MPAHCMPRPLSPTVSTLGWSTVWVAAAWGGWQRHSWCSPWVLGALSALASLQQPCLPPPRSFMSFMSFVSYIYSFMYSFPPFFLPSFMHACNSFIHSFIHLCIQSVSESVNRSRLHFHLNPRSPPSPPPHRLPDYCLSTTRPCIVLPLCYVIR